MPGSVLALSQCQHIIHIHRFLHFQIDKVTKFCSVNLGFADVDGVRGRRAGNEGTESGEKASECCGPDIEFQVVRHHI